MGIAARLRALEASGWPALRLHLAGLKVVVVGLLTSGLPFVGAAAQWLGGQNLGLFFGPAGAGRAGFVLGATVFVLPFMMSWLHVGALREGRRSRTGPRGHPGALSHVRNRAAVGVRTRRRGCSPP